jgi:ribonuclease D
MAAGSDFTLVDTPAALAAFCAGLQGVPWLALDSEFLREKTYYPKLCLLQVATPHALACIDPLALPDLSPLLTILYDPAVVKVMHAARQDLEIFYHLRGSLPAPVFDTQAAAPLLGYPEQAGYAALVETVLGVHLSKSHTRTDWSHRPLNEAQLQYAADDVRYLARLYPRLRDELERLGRLSWLEDDFNSLTDPSPYERPPEQAWLRVKGVQLLRGRRLASLQALAAWRERTARATDLPRSWLLKDETLLDLAKIQPADQAALLRVRGLNGQTAHRYGAVLLELIAASKDRAPQPLPETQRPARFSPAQEAVVELLGAAVRLIGERHALHPSAITSRKELERLVQGDRSVNVMQGWRCKLAGETLLSVLRGEIGLRVRDGTVHFTADI